MTDHPIDALEKLLASDDPEDRAEGLQQIWLMVHPSVAEIAVDFLQDPDEHVRNNAMECILRTGDARYADRVLPCLDDDDWFMRGAAITFLADWELTEHAGLIARYLDDPHPLVRSDAATGLAALGGGAALGALRYRLSVETELDAKAGLLAAIYELDNEPAILTELEGLIDSAQGSSYIWVVRHFASCAKQDNMGLIRERLTSELEKGLPWNYSDVLVELLEVLE